jgi:hypothetical protein
VTNERAIADAGKLDTGMTAREATVRARNWWDTTARHLAGTVGKEDPLMGAVSGICGGRPWDDLTKREKVQVVKHWHHFKIRRADVLDIATEAPFKLGGSEKVQ